MLGASSLSEFALYFCNPNNRNNWVFDLLKERVFVFTPFTNAWGFHHGERVYICNIGRSCYFENWNESYGRS